MYIIKKNNGYSLIELLITFGILSIISIIAIPSFINVIEKSADRAVRISLIKSFKECK